MKERICAYINDHLLEEDEETIEDNTPLYSSGLLSSMAHLRLVQFLEKHFDVALPMSELNLENFDTVTKIAGWVSSKT